MRTSRKDKAAAHVTAMRKAGLPPLPPAGFHHPGLRGARRGDDNAIPLFESALGLPAVRQSPWTSPGSSSATARLRRAHATAAARVQLTAAHDGFGWLGAEPWAARAAAELRAARGSRDAAATVLTTQEYEIAELAAAA